MDSQNDDSTSTLEQAVVNSDGLADLEEICAKRICISISKYTRSETTSPVTVSTKCTELAEENTDSTSKLSTDCQDNTSGTLLTSSQGFDNAVEDICKPSEVSSSKDCCSEANVEANESCTSNSTSITSDSDGCRRRNLRRELSTKH